MRVLARGFLAAALIVLTPTIAPADADTDRLELAGVTQVTGSHSAFVPVRIPAPVEISAIDIFDAAPPSQPGQPSQPLDNPHIEIDGAGRVFGIVLTQNGPERQKEDLDNDGATLLAVRYGMCSGAGCQPINSGADVVSAFGPGVESSGSFADERITLPGGDYNLYLLADGAPVSVTLRLQSLSGSTSMSPASPAEIHLSEATAQDGQEIEYAATEQHAFEGLGMIVASALVRNPQVSAVTGGHCIVKQTTAPAPTDPADGASGCISRGPATEIRRLQGDTSDNFHGWNGHRSFQDGGVIPAGVVKVYSSFDPGLYRVSQHYVTDGPLDDSRAFTALWLAWS